MTLIEVVLSMGIFSFIICALLSLQAAIMRTDNVSKMQMLGTVALRSQLEQSLASAYDNMDAYNSIAQGLVAHFKAMSGKPGLGDLADVRLAGNAIVYTFPVPEPGGVLEEGAENLFRNAVGTLTLYLDERSVPGNFTNWSTFYANQSGRSNSGGFDMNGNLSATDDFSGIFSGGAAAVAQSDLNSLPVRGEIRFYASEADRGTDAFVCSVVRNFIVNDNAFSYDVAARDNSPL